MRARIVVCLLLAASCSKDRVPSPLDQRTIDYTLARMNPPDTLELPVIYTDPDRAYIHDIVEGRVILKSTALTLCLAASQYRGVDAVAIAKVVPGGATSLTVYTRNLNTEKEHTRDGKVTECFQKELGDNAFPGINKDSLGGFDHAVVAVRPLMLGHRR